MRLFLAFALPEAVKAVLMALQERGRRAGLHAAWPSPELLHLTLAFLGDQLPEILPEIGRVADRVAAGRSAIPVATGALGGFPCAALARVAWLGLSPSPGLEDLAADLRRDLLAAGVALDGKAFHPHLTLARLRSPGPVSAFGPGPPPLAFAVRDMILFRSQRGAGGARHEPVACFPFR